MNKFIKTALITSVLSSFSLEAMALDWNVSLWGKRRAFTEHIEKLAELVSQRTNGSFTLNISYGGLSNNKENLDGISFGAFEMAQFCAGYHADKNPSITVLELPFLGIRSLSEERKISMALYQHPAVIADLARWNATLLMPTPLPQYNLVGTGEAPSVLKDFKGMSVRAVGGIGAAMSAVDAVPTSMTATEVRQAMDSGVVQAVSFAPHAHLSFGTIEAADWWTSNLNPGTVHCPVVVNTDALKGLSDAHRAALLGSIEDSLDHYIDNYENKTMDAWWAKLSAKDTKIITYTDKELTDFKNAAAKPAAQNWIANNTAKGLPAQEIYNFVTKMVGQ